MHQLVLVYAMCLARTYACVELVLSLACRNLGNDVGGATRSGIMRSQARRFAYVSSASTASRELVESGSFALRAFARDASICVNGVVAADVASA
jgi:hypothetical protein